MPERDGSKAKWPNGRCNSSVGVGVWSSSEASVCVLAVSWLAISHSNTYEIVQRVTQRPKLIWAFPGQAVTRDLRWDHKFRLEKGCPAVLSVLAARWILVSLGQFGEFCDLVIDFLCFGPENVVPLQLFPISPDSKSWPQNQNRCEQNAELWQYFDPRIWHSGWFF
jgi:hypothetical protein